MAVYGSVVEVGAEFIDRVLGVFAHEHVPAQSDDCVFGLAVAVVLVALAVEVDHARGV